jgi:hypothetical protein
MPQYPEPHLPRSQPHSPEWQEGMALEGRATWEAKRLSFFFKLSPPQLGQLIFVSDRTSSSNDVPQVSQPYSNIGM